MFQNKKPIGIYLIAALVAAQIAIGCYIVTSMQQKPAPPAKPVEKKSEKKDELTGVLRVYRDELLHERTIDTRGWEVEPYFFTYLRDRPAKDIEKIHLSNAARDDTIALLHGNPIRVLTIKPSHITRKCVKEIGSMTELRFLELSDVALTVEDMKTIISLPHISQLICRNCQLDDDCLQVLRNHKFTWLYLDGNRKITDRGAAYLVGQPLLNVALGETGVTDKVASILTRIPSLEEIWLFADKISDRSLPCFEKMPHLKQLFLRKTSITDAGLDRFRPPATLADLWIKDCPGVTVKGLQRFHKRYPHLFISTFLKFETDSDKNHGEQQ